MITLHYKTTIAIDNDEITSDHSLKFSTREEAEATKWSFNEGDFGDLICHDFRIEEA